MKVDLHIHTCYSPDANGTLEGIIEQSCKLGMGCLAITDHGTAEGALAMKKLAPFPVIVGEEIMSSEGEFIGYFLQKTIPSGLPPKEVIARIREQGGLVCIPHPFEGLTRCPLRIDKHPDLIPLIDIIEVFNARSLSPKYSRKARTFARQHGLLGSAGSDAHTSRDVGRAYVEMPAFDGPEEFKVSLAKGKIGGHKYNILDHFLSATGTMPKRLKNWRHV